MMAAQIPNQRVYELEDCAADPQWQARETITEWDDPMLGHVKGLGFTSKFKRNPSELWRGAPLFGMDNRDILRDLGYTDEQVQDFYDRGIVGEFDLETTIKRYRLREVIPHMRPDWKGLPENK